MSDYIYEFNENKNTITMPVRVNERRLLRNIIKYGKMLRN